MILPFGQEGFVPCAVEGIGAAARERRETDEAVRAVRRVVRRRVAGTGDANARTVHAGAVAGRGRTARAGTRVMTSVPVTRCAGVRLLPDVRRVITKPFLPGETVLPDGSTRIDVALARMLAMSDAEVAFALGSVMADFGARHRDLEAVLDQNVAGMTQRAGVPADLSPMRRRLIGAYFTHEYSIEAAALSNPSMVLAPDQHGLEPGSSRFVMSLRAIGEGHVSCIEFRTGVIDAAGQVEIQPPSAFAATGTRSGAEYDKALFIRKLDEIGGRNDHADRVLATLGDSFELAALVDAVRSVDASGVARALVDDTVHRLHWLASSSYRLSFDGIEDFSERVIFPGGATESRGMEDVRLVRFVGDDGHVVYYGTYTAYDGHQILPQLIETTDFVTFRVSTLAGPCAQNKGIALFPRKVNGRFLALGRHDNVNNFLLASSDVRVWHETALIQEPERPWELMQLGNCGSPLETEAGWLVITHGVGPMRRYSLGALLLDLDDPARVIGHLKEPLLSPGDDEREGYVPNVVYSCGSMIHGDHLVLPYGFADVGTRIATVPLEDLLARLLR